SSWAFVDLVVDLSYVVELRGKFVAPCWEIRQLGKEALFAMRALIHEVTTRSVRNLAERKRMRVAPVSDSNPSSTVLPGKQAVVLVIICLAVIGLLVYIKNGGGIKKR